MEQSKNQVAKASATDTLKKATTELEKLTDKMAKANVKLQELLANDEAELQKKTDAIEKEKAKVQEAKKKLSEVTKAGVEADTTAAQAKFDSANEGLEKKKEAKKTYQDKVKTAKSDYDKMVKEQAKLQTEIAKLSAQPATETVKAEAPKAEKAVKTEAPKAEKAPKTEKKAAKFEVKVPRLKKYYIDVVVPELIKQFGFKNVMQVPRLEKIVLNTGLGDVKDNPKSVQKAVNELALITGQKPYSTTAKKSVANFKVREGMNVGAKVTLRGSKMYEFMDKLISIVLPRVRDFKGVPAKSFDGRGNYAMGVKEQLIFPEISYDDVDKVRGFDICIVTSASTDEHAKGLLKLLGMPFMAN